MAVPSSNPKKLQRLPHVFTKVLELPLNSDADVYIQELPDCFKFTAENDHNGVFNGGGGVRAYVVEVLPGITKVVIRRRENLGFPAATIYELHPGLWQFRLPPSTRPELTTAVYAHGQLVVTVPKNGWGEDIRRGGDCNKGGGFTGNLGNPVLVQ